MDLNSKGNRNRLIANRFLFPFYAYISLCLCLLLVSEFFEERKIRISIRVSHAKREKTRVDSLPEDSLCSIQPADQAVWMESVISYKE